MTDEVKDMLISMRSYFETKIEECETIKEEEVKEVGKTWSSRYREYEYRKRALEDILEEFKEKFYDPYMMKHNENYQTYGVPRPKT